MGRCCCLCFSFFFFLLLLSLSCFLHLLYYLSFLLSCLFSSSSFHQLLYPFFFFVRSREDEEGLAFRQHFRREEIEGGGEVGGEKTAGPLVQEGIGGLGGEVGGWGGGVRRRPVLSFRKV